MESELCIGNSELTWWWRTGPLVSVLSLPSTALPLLYFLLSPLTLNTEAGRSEIKASRSTNQVQATQSTPRVYSKQHGDSESRTAGSPRLPHVTVCSRSNWSYSELFQKVRTLKSTNPVYIILQKFNSTLPRITCVSGTSYTLSCSSPGGRYQIHVSHRSHRLCHLLVVGY